ncbi:hypothetical protein [Saccharopolyspora griseoalba]|uniref:Uncharacterized protein n=1 Tax=Saccharopolyspora griseoalba TaxID=1431848 RepID=A0ABW2LSU1_9PSEU
MSTTALSCGNVDRAARPDDDGAQWHDLPGTPGRAEVDPLLAGATDRIVVHGTDADLSAVVLRLLRKERLGDLAVGYVPVADSPVARLWGLGVGDFARALRGPSRPTPLLRDDAGGILLGEGRIEPITGQGYCDDRMVLRGSALSLVASPDPDAAPLPESTAHPLSTTLDPAFDGVRVTTTRRALLRKRTETARGRALQLAFDPATVVRDGVAHPRPAEKWVWYRHTEDLHLA